MENSYFWVLLLPLLQTSQLIVPLSQADITEKSNFTEKPGHCRSVKMLNYNWDQGHKSQTHPATQFEALPPYVFLCFCDGFHPFPFLANSCLTFFHFHSTLSSCKYAAETSNWGQSKLSELTIFYGKKVHLAQVRLPHLMDYLVEFNRFKKHKRIKRIQEYNIVTKEVISMELSLSCSLILPQSSLFFHYPKWV